MKNIRIYAFLPPFVLLTIAAAYSLVIGMRNETKAIAFLSHLFDMALDTFGWFYALAALLVCLLTLFLMFSRYGDIKFGGADAQPEYSYWNWFAMTLCAGIAIGVVFWGAAQTAARRYFFTLWEIYTPLRISAPPATAKGVMRSPSTSAEKSIVSGGVM